MAIEYLHHINLSNNEIQNVKIDNKTTTQRDAMTKAAGHVIFNTTLSKFQFYDGSAWLNLQDELVASEVRAMFSQGTGITITNGQIATTITQYTDADVQSYLSSGTGVTLSNSGQISIGQDVSDNADVQFNDIQIDGNAIIDGTLGVNGNVTLGNATTDTVTIKGNLNVEGSTVTVNQTEINVQNAFVFEGASQDAHETTLSIVDPTADRTINLPDADGTIALTSGLRTDDQIKGVVGGMISNNTESGISVTYDSTNKNLDFNVSDPTITLTGDVTGSGTITNLGNVSIALDTVKNKAANGTGPEADNDTDFTFQHGLATSNVIVQAFKSSKMVMCDVEIIDSNNVKLVFAQGQTADSITVNVISAAS